MPAGQSTPGHVHPAVLGIARVRGRSMLPTLGDGDRLVVRYGAGARPGHVVLARLADGTLAVKRVESRRSTRAGAPGFWLVSDNPAEGVDSRHRGVVPADQVLGVVLGRVWPRPRLLGRSRRRSTTAPVGD